MSKRIEFIAPVDAMRGNLSGKQNLLYAENDNPAFEAPDGLQYARNYQPRFIGAKRSATGLKYFAVRTKNAVNNTNDSRFAQACLGAASAIATAVMETASIWSAFESIYTTEYNYRKAHNLTKAKTMRAFLTELYCEQLKDKLTFLDTYMQSEPGTLISMANPYNVTQFDPERDPSINDAVLIKFWTLLAQNAITFKVGQFKCVAHANDTWAIYCQENYNTIGASVSSGKIKVGDLWLKCIPYPGGEVYVTDGTTVSTQTPYFLTNVAPE